MDTHRIVVRDTDGNVLEDFTVQAGSGAAIGGLRHAPTVDRLEVVPVSWIPSEVLAHLDDIVQVAASAIQWRNTMKQPDLDAAARRRTMLDFLRHSAVLDSVHPAVRGWLQSQPLRVSRPKITDTKEGPHAHES